VSKLMPNNEAVWDRAVRVVLGVAVLSLIFWGPKTLWGLVGLVPFATGLLGTCPVYTLCGFGTCSPKQAPGA